MELGLLLAGRRGGDDERILAGGEGVLAAVIVALETELLTETIGFTGPRNLRIWLGEHIRVPAGE